jgi:hypothetical protein
MHFSFSFGGKIIFLCGKNEIKIEAEKQREN